MKNDLISIVVPIYNVEKYLNRCIDSVINQTYKNLEIILVDDGSNDNSGMICDQYAKKDKRIRVIHQDNAGQAAARNLGIELARGKYLAFVDSDDYITLDYIEYLYNLLIKYNADMSICSYRIITNKKIVDAKQDYFELEYNTSNCLNDMLLSRNLTVSPCMKLYKKDLIKNIKFPVGKICEDNGTTYKFIASSKKIIYGNKANYNYYRRNGSTMNQSFSPKYFDILEMTDIMSNDLTNNYKDIIDAINFKNMEVRFTVLRKIAESNNYNLYRNEVLRIKKELITYYKSINNKQILSLKDKVGYYSLRLSFKIFSLFWKLYRKIKYSD